MITSKGLAALIKKGGLNWTQALYFLTNSELVKVGRVLFEKLVYKRKRVRMGRWIGRMYAKRKELVK